jgi:peptidoglycan hydrolase-like protein with peptidoglycan-binding domain
MRELHTTLQEGASGEDVRTVQGLLIARGHQVAVDGAFGPATKQATEDLQHAAGIAVDGIAGEHTWQALLKV